MDATRAMHRQLLEMLFGAIPFMGEKIVEGILPMKFGHQSIPRHFGHDRGRRDGQAERITLDDGAERDGAIGQSNRVNEQAIRLRSETGQRTTHGEAGRFKNVELVDFFVARRTDPDADRAFVDRDVELFPLGFSEKLGIVAADQPAPSRQDDGRRDHRTGQRTSTRFIQAGDPAIPASAGFQFKFVCGTHEVKSACGHPLPRGR